MNLRLTIACLNNKHPTKIEHNTQMLNKLKNISSKLSPEARKQAQERNKAKSEALAIIESEVNRIFNELENIADGRLPGIKFSRAIQSMKDRIDGILIPFNISHQDLPEATQIQSLEKGFRLKTLERYNELIPSSDTITPFATFREIFKARDGHAFAQDKELESAYQLAARALFSHKALESTLVDRMEKKIKILGETKATDDNQERRQITTLVQNYNLCKTHQPSLASNTFLETKIAEIEAILYFQEHIAHLEAGTIQPNQQLNEYINHWMVYLNELSAEEQQARMVLIQVADQCSMLNNTALQPT